MTLNEEWLLVKEIVETQRLEAVFYRRVLHVIQAEHPTLSPPHVLVLVILREVGFRRQSRMKLSPLYPLHVSDEPVSRIDSG
jgi:hypothetical protein